MDSPTSDPWALPLGVLAAACLGVAIQDLNGRMTRLALVMVTVAIAACAAAALLRPDTPRAAAPEAPELWPERLATVVIALSFAFQFYALATYPAAIHEVLRPGMNHSTFSGAIAVAGALVGLTLARSQWLRLVAVLGLIAAHMTAATFVLHASPSPDIDVFVFQNDALEALLHGHNPYGIDFPNIYDNTRLYGEGVVVNGRLNIGFPYPPLSLLLALPGQLLAGDFRFSQLAAMNLAALGMAWLGRRGFGPAAAAIYLFTPRSFFVLEQAWTEPFVVAAFVLLLVAGQRWPGLRGVLAGVLLATKQHLILLALVAKALPESWTKGRAWVRGALVAVATAAALTFPWMITASSGFMNGVVWFQFRQPFREDSLSYLALIARKGGPQLGSWPAFVMLIPVATLVTLKTPRSLAGFSFAAALLYLVFFAFNKQAFCNYYDFALGLVCCAVAALSAEPANDAGLPARTSRAAAPSGRHDTFLTRGNWCNVQS